MLAKGRRVIVVEDEPLIAIMIEEMLIELGWEVAAIAYSAPAAIAELETCQPALTVLDINLGPTSSLAVASGVPVLFTTGYTAKNILPECGQAPVLAKPFSPVELAASVERALQGA